MIANIQSSCECQARLCAELDENRQVLRSWALDRRRSAPRTAPAHSIHAERGVFQVGWACPVCGRNTLRSFEVAGLAWSE